MMTDCDTLLMVGSSFPYSEFLPEEGQARGVQIDIDGRMIGIRYPMEVQLVGDSKATLQALHPAASSASRTAPGASRSKQNVADWWELMEERALEEADPINPQRALLRAVEAVCPTARSSAPTRAPRPTGTRAT